MCQTPNAHTHTAKLASLSTTILETLSIANAGAMAAAPAAAACVLLPGSADNAVSC